MNPGKEKQVPQRNITPNFIRFKSTSTFTQGNLAMASLPRPKNRLGMIKRTPNVAHPKPADAALKSTKNEFSTSAN